MVRAVVGTLTQVGKGKMTQDEFQAVIGSAIDLAESPLPHAAFTLLE